MTGLSDVAHGEEVASASRRSRIDPPSSATSMFAASKGVEAYTLVAKVVTTVFALVARSSR